MTTRAIILAAGTNSRLRNYVADVPKSLLPIGSSTILGRQISLLIKNGLKKEDIFVVSGYMDEKIRALHENLLLNTKYGETDNAYSLHIALACLQKLPDVHPEDEVFVLDCDLVYDENLILKVKQAKFKNVLVTRKEHLQELSTEEIVVPDDTGRIGKISRFCDENIKNQSKNSKEQFVYTGILKMSNSTSEKLDSTLLEKECWTKWYTSALADLFATVPFFNFPLSEQSFCLDIDTKEDYEKVSNIIKEAQK